MLFDGFIVLDSRDNVKHPGPPSNPTGSAPASKTDSSSYGEGTPMPYGPVQNPPPAPGGSSGGDSGSGGVGQYITPGTIVAGTQLLGTFATMFKKTPEQKTIKAICGRKPLLNTGGKKDKYLACVDNYLNPKQNVSQDTGMSSGTKALIGILVFIFIALIVAMIVMMNKNKAAA